MCNSLSRFQFMKACYGTLKVPNVPGSHSWSADKVKAFSTAGDVYIRAFHPLKEKQESASDRDPCEVNDTDSGTSSSNQCNQVAEIQDCCQQEEVIMEYGSTPYIGMARGKNGRPISCVQIMCS